VTDSTDAVKTRGGQILCRRKDVRGKGDFERGGKKSVRAQKGVAGERKEKKAPLMELKRLKKPEVKKNRIGRGPTRWPGQGGKQLNRTEKDLVTGEESETRKWLRLKIILFKTVSEQKFGKKTRARRENPDMRGGDGL